MNPKWGMSIKNRSRIRALRAPRVMPITCDANNGTMGKDDDLRGRNAWTLHDEIAIRNASDVRAAWMRIGMVG